MKSFLVCCLYLCVAANVVKSATYYYRAGREGREIIVPLVDEMQQPLIVELKKDPLVAVDEPAVVAAVVEETVPDVAVRAEPEAVVKPIEAVAEESRLIPAPVEKLETLEIVPPAGSPLKSATISETVKAAAIEAVADTKVAPVVEIALVPEVKSPVVQDVPVQVGDNVVPVVEAVAVPEVKSTPQLVPANEIVIPVEKVEEKLVDAPVPEAKEPPKEAEPAVRQNPPAATPTNPIQAFIQPIQQGFQQSLETFIQPIQNALGIRPNAQSDAVSADSPSVSVEAVTPVAPTSPSGPAAFFQQVSQSLSNILRPQGTAATVPAAASAPAAPAENEIKGGETSVHIIQHSNDVNDKVDVAKAAEKIE